MEHFPPEISNRVRKGSFIALTAGATALVLLFSVIELSAQSFWRKNDRNTFIRNIQFNFNIPSARGIGLAGAFVAEDLEEVVRIGLAEIPRTSRLYEAVSQTVKWCKENDDWEVTCDRILAAYGHYHGVHTINNACLVVMGLLHSGGDFGRAVGMAVMGGLDTDCNGATAGSVMGAWLGAAALPSRFTRPLNDRLASYVVGMTDNSISDLARRTVAVATLRPATS